MPLWRNRWAGDWVGPWKALDGDSGVTRPAAAWMHRAVWFALVAVELSGLTLVATVKDVTEGLLQLLGGADDGLVNGRRVMRDRNGLVPLEARFHQAALVRASTLLAVLIAKVDFHAGDMVSQVVERVLHGVFSLPGHCFMTVDVATGIDQYFHKVMVGRTGCAAFDGFD